jgi:hypothetical protein
VREWFGELDRTKTLHTNSSQPLPSGSHVDISMSALDADRMVEVIKFQKMVNLIRCLSAATYEDAMVNVKWMKCLDGTAGVVMRMPPYSAPGDPMETDVERFEIWEDVEPFQF